VLDKMNSVADSSFSYSHNVTKDDRAMLAVNSEQGPVYSMRLDREKLSTEAFNLDHVLAEF
jgi:hypothetical protein